MRNMSFSHALNQLAHPITLLGFGLILLNALWLQPVHPSWLSGKLGDLGWMMCGPVLAALLLSPWIVRRRTLGWAAVSVTGIGFGLLKTLPLLNGAAHNLFALSGLTLKLALDASDLLVLPGLALAVWAWFGPALQSASVLRLAGAGLAAFAFMADAAAPLNLGVKCVAVQDGALLAFREREFTSGYIFPKESHYWDVLKSTDGGLSWIQSDTFSDKNRAEDELYAQLGALLDACAAVTPGKWVDDPQTPALGYMISDQDAIYRSEDNHVTLVREMDLEPGDVLTSYVFDPATGNLVLGMGTGGIMARTQDSWQRFKE